MRLSFSNLILNGVGKCVGEVFIGDLGVEHLRKSSTEVSGSRSARLVLDKPEEAIVEIKTRVVSIDSGNLRHSDSHSDGDTKVDSSGDGRGTDSELLSEISGLASLKLVSQLNHEFVQSLDGSHPKSTQEIVSGTEERVRSTGNFTSLLVTISRLRVDVLLETLSESL